MLRLVGGMAWIAALGCSNFVEGAKQGFKEGYETKFREQFTTTCRSELGQDQVCSCMADQLVQRVPPKKLVELSLHPHDPALEQIVKGTLKTCGGQLIPRR